MTTAREVQRIVRPFLERNPDFVLHGRDLLLPPVEHILRTIVFDRTHDRRYFDVFWTASATFWPQRTLWVSFRVYSRIATRLLCVSTPETHSVILSELEDEAAPMLRAIQNLDDFVAFANHPRNAYGSPIRVLEHAYLPLAVARGEFATARTIIEGWKRALPAVKKEDEYILMIRKQIADFDEPLARGDKPALAAALYEREAFTVSNLKLEPLYEKRPFPALETTDSN